TSGSSCVAACGSPCSTADRMRVTSLMTTKHNAATRCEQCSRHRIRSNQGRNSFMEMMPLWPKQNVFRVRTVAIFRLLDRLQPCPMERARARQQHRHPLLAGKKLAAAREQQFVRASASQTAKEEDVVLVEARIADVSFDGCSSTAAR